MKVSEIWNELDERFLDMASRVQELQLDKEKPLLALFTMHEWINHLPFKALMEKELEMIERAARGEDPLPHVEADLLIERSIIGMYPLGRVREATKIHQALDLIEGRIWRLGWATGYLAPIKKIMECAREHKYYIPIRNKLISHWK